MEVAFHEAIHAVIFDSPSFGFAKDTGHEHGGHSFTTCEKLVGLHTF